MNTIRQLGIRETSLYAELGRVLQGLNIDQFGWICPFTGLEVDNEEVVYLENHYAQLQSPILPCLWSTRSSYHFQSRPSNVEREVFR